MSHRVERAERKRKKLEALINLVTQDPYKTKSDVTVRTNKESASESAGSVDEPHSKRRRLAAADDERRRREEARLESSLSFNTQSIEDLRRAARKATTARFRPSLHLQLEKLRLYSQPKSPPCLFLSDVEQLVRFAASKGLKVKDRPRWCGLEHPEKMTSVVLVLVEGVGGEEEGGQDLVNLFPKLHRLLDLHAPLASPDLLLRGESSSDDDETQRTRETKADDDSAADVFPRTDLLLSAKQMAEECCPLPGLSDWARGYGYSRQHYSPVTSHSPIFGLDCEMCETAEDEQALTRCSLVNERLETVYDEYVLPPTPVTDYKTQFSGITAKHLRGVSNTLEDTRRALSSLLPPDAILVGQSLGFDLRALKMYHPYLIDTSVVYSLSGNKHRKTGLRKLTDFFLNRRIQEGGGGHDSVEDAKAAVELVKLKLHRGPSFGDLVHANSRTFLEPLTPGGASKSDQVKRRTESKPLASRGKDKAVGSPCLDEMVRRLVDSCGAYTLRATPPECGGAEGCHGNTRPSLRVSGRRRGRRQRGDVVILRLDLSQHCPQCIRAVDTQVSCVLANVKPDALIGAALCSGGGAPRSRLLLALTR